MLTFLFVPYFTVLFGTCITVPVAPDITVPVAPDITVPVAPWNREQLNPMYTPETVALPHQTFFSMLEMRDKVVGGDFVERGQGDI